MTSLDKSLDAQSALLCCLFGCLCVSLRLNKVSLKISLSLSCCCLCCCTLLLWKWSDLNVNAKGLCSCLHRQGDATTVKINLHDLYLYNVANLADLRWSGDVLLSHLGDVNEAFNAVAKVNKCTKLNDGGNSTLELHANLELAQDVLTLCLTSLLKNNTARKNNVVAVAIHLDNTSLNTSAHECTKILDTTEVNKGCRQEATEANVKNQAALNNLDNLALNGLTSAELILNCLPSTLVLSTLLGENQTALFVLFLENKSLDVLTQGDDLCRVNVFTNRKLTSRNNALRLVANVYEDLIALNLDDGAVDKISLIKIGNSAVDQAVHFLIGNFIQREDGRVLNLTQRWTPSKTGPRSTWLLPECQYVGFSTRKLTCSRGPTDTVHSLTPYGQ